MKQLDILIVNEGEGAAIAAQAGLTASSLCDVPRQLAQRYGLSCILTLGAEGAIVAGSGNNFSVDAASVTPLDTTWRGRHLRGRSRRRVGRRHGFKDQRHAGQPGGSLACTVTGAQTSIPTASVIDANSHLLPKIKSLS